MSSHEFFEYDVLHEASIDGIETSYRSESTKTRKRKARLQNETQKRKLTALIKKEELIWNRKHKLHRNSNALNSAWNRVSDRMSSMSVEECRIMWKSIRDALRYRKKVAMKNDCMADLSDSTQFVEGIEEHESDKISIHISENSESQNESGIFNSLNKEELSRNCRKRNGMNEANEVDKRLLVELIKSEELIWNTKHELHFNPSSIESAWRRIAETMSLTVNQCQFFWKSLQAKEDDDFVKALSLFPTTSNKLQSTILSCSAMDDGETRFSRLASNNSNASEQSERSVKIEDSENIFFIEGIKLENDTYSMQESIISGEAEGNKAEVKKTIFVPRKYNLKNEKKKKMLVELLKVEKVIWDIEHELHFSNEAVDDAWKRVANQMPDKMSIEQCKTMWRSLRDALRYRRKLAIKEKFSENGTDKYQNESENGNLLEEILSLFGPNTRKVTKKISVPIEINTDTIHSRPDSNCSYVSQNNEHDELAKSLAGISNAIVSLINIAKNTQSIQVHDAFKYDYVWRLIESLYIKMDESTVNELNQKIINLAYEYCKVKHN